MYGKNKKYRKQGLVNELFKYLYIKKGTIYIIEKK